MTHHATTASARPGRARLGSLLALSVLALACGTDDNGDRGEQAQAPADRTAADQLAPEPAEPGTFPERPQLTYDLRERPDGWPADAADGESSAHFDDDGLALQADGSPLWIAAPDEVEPGHRGVLLEAEVTPGDGGDSVGVFCRGAPDRGVGYALTVGPDRHWSLWRFEDDSQAVLADGTMTQAQLPDVTGPVQLVLTCGTGLEGQQVTLGFAVGATATLDIRYDGLGLPAGASTRMGVLALPDGDQPVEAHATSLAVSLAEAQADAGDEAEPGG